MNKEHIAIGYRALDRAVPSSFYLGTWMSRASSINSVEDLHECGTTACAAGFLALSKEFHAKGGSKAFGGYPIYGWQNADDALHTFYETKDSSIEHDVICAIHGIEGSSDEKYEYQILEFFDALGIDSYTSKPLDVITPKMVREKFAILHFILCITNPKEA